MVHTEGCGGVGGNRRKLAKVFILPMGNWAKMWREGVKRGRLKHDCNKIRTELVGWEKLKRKMAKEPKIKRREVKICVPRSSGIPQDATETGKTLGVAFLGSWGGA